MTMHQQEVVSSAPKGAGVQRRGVMETVIETTATALGNTVAFMVEYGILFVIFAIVWGAFAAGLIWSQGSVDAAWQFIRDLPLLLQGVIWLLFLPVMIALWAWESTWPLVIRLMLVLGIGAWNLFIFLPRALRAAP